MIKADSRVWSDLLGITLTYVLVGIGWLLFGVQTPFLAYPTLVWIGNIRRIRRFKRLDKRRQAVAVLGDQIAPRALPQPLPTTEVLPVPWTLSSGPSWLFFGLMVPLAFVGVLLLPLLAFHPQNPLSPPAHLAVSILLTALLTAWYPLWTSYQRIDVTEECLSVRSLFRRCTLHWSEVSLFAIDPPTIAGDRTLTYELSSVTTTVHWKQALSSSRLIALDRPFPEYEQQMEALLSFITAKTGLPLYDLR